MNTDSELQDHYSRGDLLARLRTALAEDGADPDHPTPDSLAPYDHFHGRGLEATLETARLMPARAGQRILDIGSGLGGPARYVANRFRCHVTGIDLTPEYCELAQHLTRLQKLEDRTSFQQGDALAMPFEAQAFDGAYSMNVSMNIEHKAALYREMHRVLKPGGWLVLSEVSRGEGGDIDYPTAWADSARTSFLSTPEETRQGLLDAGFEVLRFRSTLEKTRAFGDRSRAMVKRGEKPPHRAVMLIHGEKARAVMANTIRGFADGRIVPIEVLCRKPEPAA
ncbi:class I SAM-dependent methyltransferase [Ramlibacter sp.]|uniref:class I SAM-dependent methyltransferase n=1 Tax=Ramlibacter sp. TaxID=1917967 RepID=UPI002BF01075|nr:methyltransferase domain-containing protein [Ramlibacter sp.]HWI84360.1 methyltransferase domain-containing protein [Ramlibacter sp.]